VSAGDRSRLDTRELAAYLEGEVTRSERRAIDAALRVDAASRKRLDELRHVRDRLSAPVPELERLDLTAGVRAALARPERKRDRSWLWTLGSAAALASAAGLFLRFAPPAPASSEFRAKSASFANSESERWAGVQIHRVSGTAGSERVRDRLAVGDGLVFAYSNLGPAPFDYLMIFAVDARGEVFWFHPAYERPGTDPSALPIEKGASETRLPELVHHDFARGPLAIYGLFARRPLRVSEVEASLERHGSPMTWAPPWPETRLQRLRVRVDP